MAPRRAVVIALIAAVGPATAVADRLVDAYLHGDEAAVSREGRAASARGLEPLLVSPDRPSALAAIEASPAADDAWELMPILADLATSSDRPIARAAAHAASSIASKIDAEAVAMFDIPRVTIENHRDAWRAIAERSDRWADVRVLGLEISQRLSRAVEPHALGFDLDAALLDLDGEYRRAALELLPSPVPDALRPSAARAAVEDPDSIVALVAAQALCSGLAFGDPPAPILDALGEPGLERIRTAVVDRDMPIAARVDAARCLGADGSPASIAAIRKLAAGAPPHLRKAVSAMARTSNPQSSSEQVRSRRQR